MDIKFKCNPKISSGTHTSIFASYRQFNNEIGGHYQLGCYLIQLFNSEIFGVLLGFRTAKCTNGIHYRSMIHYRTTQVKKKRGSDIRSLTTALICTLLKVSKPF